MKKYNEFINENFQSPYNEFMLEWNVYDENGKWKEFSTYIHKNLSDINKYIDENKLTMSTNQYSIKGWSINDKKWITLISSNRTQTKNPQ